MADVLLVSMRALRRYFARVMKSLDLKLKRHFCSISSEVYISFNAAEFDSRVSELNVVYLLFNANTLSFVFI